MDRKKFIGGLLVLVITISIIRYKNGTEKPLVDVVTKTPTPLPTSVETIKEEILIEYRNEELGFTVKHPSDIPSEILEDGTISFSLVNIDQNENDKFSDGLVVAVQQKWLDDNEILEEKVNIDRQDYIDKYGNEVRQISETEINGIKGLVFGNDDTVYIYLPQKENKYLRIIRITYDPNGYGYQEKADSIIQSLKLI